MKLTEKELNEFPVGTKIQLSDKRKLIKSIMLDTTIFQWHELNTNTWYTDFGVSSRNVEKVEIPTYTEYIPPKPILDEKEKEYLSGVIRPWRDKLIFIRKMVHYAGYERIQISRNDTIWFMNFPDFKAGTMYKGMELDKEYSLDELGL